MTDIKFINSDNGKIAYQLYKGTSKLPPIVFLCGFKSDMGGSKSQWLHDYCVENNRTYLCFDYFAHGASDGDFMDFTISHGLMNAFEMINELIDQPAIIIGSSMGGWIGLRLLQLCPDKIHGFIGIAAAPDFTRTIYAQLDDGHLHQLDDKGYMEEESEYDEPYIFTQKLFNDGENQCVLDTKIQFDGDVYLLQGKQDTSVDFNMPDAINNMLGGKAHITLIEDGDHSLSRPQDLDILKSCIEQMQS